MLKTFDVGVEETRVGAVVFSDEAERVLDLKEGVSKDAALERVKNITWGKGNTFMDKAFVKMRRIFKRKWRSPWSGSSNCSASYGRGRYRPV